MGEKDTKAKEYLADNERFADLCNYVLFGEEQVISADALEARDTTEILSALGVDEKEMKAQQKWRDLLKRAIIKYTGEMYVVLIGVENQELFSAMDNESIEVINTFIGTEIPYNESEGGNNVCKAWDDHKESGRREGRIEGRAEEIYASVRDGDYSAARGAEKLGISVQELEKRMEDAGYPLPFVM